MISRARFAACLTSTSVAIATIAGGAVAAVMVAGAPAANAATGTYQDTADTWADAAALLGTAGSLWQPKRTSGLTLRGQLDVVADNLSFAKGVATSGDTAASGRYGTKKRGFTIVEKWANTGWAAEPAPDIRSAPVGTVTITLGDPGTAIALKARVRANCYPYQPKHPKPPAADFRCSKSDVSTYGGTLTMTARPSSTMLAPGDTTIAIDSQGMTYAELVAVARGLVQVPGLPEAASAEATFICLDMVQQKMTAEQAASLATSNGFTTRVGSIDGVGRMLTADYSPSRFTLSLTGGIVTACPAG